MQLCGLDNDRSREICAASERQSDKLRESDGRVQIGSSFLLIPLLFHSRYIAAVCIGCLAAALGMLHCMLQELPLSSAGPVHFHNSSHSLLYLPSYFFGTNQQIVQVNDSNLPLSPAALGRLKQIGILLKRDSLE